MSTRRSVIIVRCGLNDLTDADLLARQGIACMAVERHVQISVQYKFAEILPFAVEGSGQVLALATESEPILSRGFPTYARQTWC